MVEDLAGFGKIAEVICSAIGKTVGAIYKPRKTRLVGYAKADVEAYSIIKKAEAEKKARLIQESPLNEALLSSTEDMDLRARAGQRLVTQEMTRQKNIEAIVAEATEQAHNAEKVGAEPRLLDEDWINAFLDYSQNASNENLRHIWAKILATQATEGEPTVSKATLDAIRLIEPQQAKLFERAVRLYLAMGQIMDVDPVDNFDIGYHSQTLAVTALEDLGLLKRLRDLEPNLELHGGILTFWRDTFQSRGIEGETIGYWTNPDFREKWTRDIMALFLEDTRDYQRLSDPIRIERQILTSRGFELAAIIVSGFYDILQRKEEACLENLGDFANTDMRRHILNQWAARFSAQGAAVIFAEPHSKDFANDKGETGLKIEFEPKMIFHPDKGDWEPIKT